jgi:hypothetical protein
MTPLTLLATTRLRNRKRLTTQRRTTCALVCRPRGVLHAYVGPLTRSGRSVPRAARPTCGVRTRALGVVPLSEVRRRRVCARCTARLLTPVQEAGHPTRGQLLDAYAGVTDFDLALDAWRAETPEDLERVEHLALLLLGPRAAAKTPVVAPITGKVTGPVDDHVAQARRRLGITRDPLGPDARATANENELIARHAAKGRRKAAWQDREDRIERLGFVNATARSRPA